MKERDRIIFIRLFKEAYKKCFDHDLTEALSEADSKHLANNILDKTGLTIGSKSLKNYSFYVLAKKEYRKENPSTATLDTLARYVLNAPETNEIHRKGFESHYPYWFQYRSEFLVSSPGRSKFRISAKKAGLGFILVLSAVLLFVAIKSIMKNRSAEGFIDSFDSVSENELHNNGWTIQNSDTLWWTKRDEEQGHLSLFTLKGDNWGEPENTAAIKNLVTRKINSECFSVETHLTRFIPSRNWQQAGILLSEDPSSPEKAIRISIAYNDYYGGYEQPAEIIIQIVGLFENGNQSKPEEIAHLPIYTFEPGSEELIEDNLARSALKIEKRGNRLRFLFATGSMTSFAYKEVASREFSLEPQYVSLFASHGWTDATNPIPARFDSFYYSPITCGD